VRLATRVPTHLWLSAFGPQHPRSRGAGNSCSRSVCLTQPLNGRGYTESSHLAGVFVASSKSWVRVRTVRKQLENKKRLTSSIQPTDP
jgi:hypothetical protein